MTYLLIAVFAVLAIIFLIGCIYFMAEKNKYAAVFSQQAEALRQKDLELQKKAIDDERWQGNIADLEQKKAAAQADIERLECEADRLGSESLTLQKELLAAQEASGLPETDGEAYVDWLHDREAAEERQKEAELFIAEKQPIFAKAAQLLEKLRQCDQAMPFMNNMTEAFPAWVDAARRKISDNRDAEKIAAEAEKQCGNCAEDVERKQQRLKELEEQIKQANTAWADKVKTLFGGQLNEAAARNIQALEKLAEAEKQAARMAAEQRRNDELLAAALRELPQAEDAEQFSANNIASALQMAELEKAETEKAFSQAVEERTNAQREWEAIGKQDKTAELEQQKATLGLELQDLCQTYAEQSLGLALAQNALSVYREKHRSGMMLATEKAFAELTNGGYPALQTRPDGNNEILLAVSKDGESLKRADEMSKGTRFQLYMALRAAAYEQLLAKNISLPFFCDDVFESFDDARTRAACRLMQHIGRQGQAIYFTHHRHVADIAKEICGDNVQIHTI